MKNKKGALYLIPSTLGEGDPRFALPDSVYEATQNIKHYAVENIRSARRFLIKMQIPFEIDELTFSELNKRTGAAEMDSILKPLISGHNVGIVSEAGCPGVADPGAVAVRWAHEHGVKIIPMIGPSSILLALIGSGLNGQGFTFSGYLPRERKQRMNSMKQLERDAQQKKQTQVFMETPYRNNYIIEDILEVCAPTTLFTIACDLTLPSEYIKTKPVALWKKSKAPDIHKRPAIFLLGIN